MMRKFWLKPLLLHCGYCHERPATTMVMNDRNADVSGPVCQQCARSIMRRLSRIESGKAE